MKTYPSIVFQKGLTLIEVLVTLLVLSIGLVGIAALHLTSLQNAHSSYYTSIASTIALDFEERLWLKVAEEGPKGCLVKADADDVAGSLEDDWLAGETNNMGIPGLNVTAGAVTAVNDTRIQVPLTISWTDDRFDGTEEFNYAVRVVCWPEEDDDDEEETES